MTIKNLIKLVQPAQREGSKLADFSSPNFLSLSIDKGILCDTSE